MRFRQHNRISKRFNTLPVNVFTPERDVDAQGKVVRIGTLEVAQPFDPDFFKEINHSRPNRTGFQHTATFILRDQWQIRFNLQSNRFLSIFG